MSVKIYIDESVPVAITAGLQRRGVAAFSARDCENLGVSDEKQLAYATEHGMAIFTHDSDFLQLAHQCTNAGKHHCGVIYVHQHHLSIGECIRRLKEIADILEPADLYDHIEFL